ncbi:uncharacterized protein [Watersipora subatra]|uniref:uncharacterized protein n=1 Tax=Watersipora subatra TaxID=2589382 RepID=UPI00355B5A57
MGLFGESINPGGYYYAIVHRLELPSTIDKALGIGVVASLGIGWAISRQIRASSILVLPSIFTREGRFMLTAISYTLLLTGPLANIVANADETLRGVSCTFNFLASQRAERLNLLNEPLQAYTKKVGLDLSAFDNKLKKLINNMAPPQFSASSFQDPNSLDEDGSREYEQYIDENSEDRTIENRNQIDDMTNTGESNCRAEPGQGSKKWATGSIRMKWTRTDNTDLMQCYFMSEPQKWGYMGRMHQLWVNMRPELPLIAKQLVAQRSNIIKRHLISELDVDEIREQFTQVSSTNEECISTYTVTHAQSCVDSRVEEDMHFDLDPRVKELAKNIINKMPAANDYGSRVPLRKVSKAIPKKLLEDINLALESISTESISEINSLIYSTATVILEEIVLSHCQQGFKPFHPGS